MHRMPRDEAPTVTFLQVYPGAVPPMRADKSALGLMTTMAYRHCEAMRSASALGWYIFPPEEIFLKWNGCDVFVRQDGEWVPLVRMELPGFGERWDDCAPEALRGLAPPFLTRLQVPGLVQIWSGLLCGAAPGWSVLIRPPVNMRASHLYESFEGLVECDRFSPFPLFTNIQLIATDVVIHIPKLVPLFQVLPLLRETYGDAAHRVCVRDGMELSEDEWRGYRSTIRVESADGPAELGHYTRDSRKRTKSEP